jgi:hypothetical protein
VNPPPQAFRALGAHSHRRTSAAPQTFAVLAPATRLPRLQQRIPPYGALVQRCALASISGVSSRSVDRQR